jgi:hypothetical protein
MYHLLYQKVRRPMQRHAISIIATLLLYGACPAVHAGTIVYNVNMTGFTMGAGGPVDSNLSVVGTITYDTTSQLITTSSLSINDPTLLATLPSTLTVQTLTPAYLDATPTALYAVPNVGTGVLIDYWGTVSTTTYSLSIFDNASGAVFVEITGPYPTISPLHSGGFGEEGIFGSSTEVLIGTATPEPPSYVLVVTGFVLAGGVAVMRRNKPRALANTLCGVT